MTLAYGHWRAYIRRSRKPALGGDLTGSHPTRGFVSNVNAIDDDVQPAPDRSMARTISLWLFGRLVPNTDELGQRAKDIDNRAVLRQVRRRQTPLVSLVFTCPLGALLMERSRQ